MKKKYIVFPGAVTSKTDGQRHYISHTQLMRLYGVDPRECELYEPTPWSTRSVHFMAEDHQDGMICLAPRYDGNYELPIMS